MVCIMDRIQNRNHGNDESIVQLMLVPFSVGVRSKVTFEMDLNGLVKRISSTILFGAVSV